MRQAPDTRNSSRATSRARGSRRALATHAPAAPLTICSPIVRSRRCLASSLSIRDCKAAACWRSRGPVQPITTAFLADAWSGTDNCGWAAWFDSAAPATLNPCDQTTAARVTATATKQRDTGIARSTNAYRVLSQAQAIWDCVTCLRNGDARRTEVSRRSAEPGVQKSSEVQSVARGVDLERRNRRRIIEHGEHAAALT